METERRNIPDEILLDILSRLPPKSLVRFQSVSKSLCASISNPSFTLSSPNHRIAALSTFTSRSFFTIDVTDYAEEQLRAEHSTSNSPIPTEPCPDSLIGSYKGLLLVSYGTSIYLLNPSTRNCRLVLKNAHQLRNVGLSGFCYDASSNDYKFVVVANASYRFYVSSLKTRSRREIKTPSCLYFPKCGPSLVDEKMHWLVEKKCKLSNQYSVTIICFDAGKDAFNELQILQPFYDQEGKKKKILGLGVLDGSLALTCGVDPHPCFPYKGNVEVWILKHYCIPETWCCLFVIEHFNPIYSPLEPLFVTRQGEYILQEEREIFAYNPVTKLLRVVVQLDFRIGTMVYVESMLRPEALAF